MRNLGTALVIGVVLAIVCAPGASASGVRGTRIQPARSAGRCAHVKSTDALNILCNVAGSIVASRRMWDNGYPRLTRLYGGVANAPHMSEKGRAAWRKLTNDVGRLLEIPEELCSPRRAHLRARLKVAPDRELMKRMCVVVVDDLVLYRIAFIDVSERRLPNAREIKMQRIAQEELTRNQPFLRAAVKAATPL